MSPSHKNERRPLTRPDLGARARAEKAHDFEGLSVSVWEFPY